MIKWSSVVFGFFFINFSFAGVIGRFGGLYPVTEIDIKEVIYQRLHALEDSGELESVKNEFIARVNNQIDRPQPLSLVTTPSPATFYVDPSLHVLQDITTPEGQLIAKKGTVINPFSQITLHKALIFFNADDKRQVNWVKNHFHDYNQVKFILTGGSVRKTMHIFGRVYFDFHGQLAKKLVLKHVPSIATQEGLSWKIVEGQIL